MFIVFFIIILIQINFKSTAAAVYNYGHEVSTKSNMNTVTIQQPSKILFEVSKLRDNLKDLKANIFDKMLSDEMLSIKQQIFERNSTPSTVQISSKRYVPTPILELQQRWPIDRIQSNMEKKLDFEKHMKKIDEIADTKESNEQEDFKCKSNCTSASERVLELRSLSEKLHKIEMPTKNPRLPKPCTCINGVDHSHTSAHKHTRHTLGLKKPDEQSSKNPNECTRSTSTVPTITYPFYITYSPYFVGTVVDYTNFYYHPDAISDLKIPKHHKNRKHKKPASEEIDNSLENDRDYVYYEYDEYTKSTRRHRGKTKPDDNFNVHPTNEPDNSLNNREHFQIVDKDKFVEEIVEDLKMYYNEAVIKDCYCSSSSFKIGLQIIIFVYLLQFLI
ncbi:uncharacterized protein LOC123712781 isoform X2 [Pieris brassicae]|uniref:uncharacterized protein LOC123712781 isoform X2 n=1 Tax=Pieris brassicae TaxID=7116 RepID=UPI001E6621ED|nr:uncharacterized protein LOC123712781 isoform X2 [Pieris brassicae]